MIDRTARRTPAAVALAAALLAVLALCAALQPTVARAEEPSGDIITVLQPGENLVGWIAAEAPVGDLFAAVPEIEAVWAWDTRRRRWQGASPRIPEAFHSLTKLTPGMGLLIKIGGDQPVEWTRSAVPARGLVQLRPGPNLVAWAGPDDSQITWLSKGIGISLVSAGLPSSGETDWSFYDPEDAATAEAFPAVNRGDALWVTSSRNINWLQPTGVLPKLEFPGGASRSFRNSVRADLESVLKFYGENYAIQADFLRGVGDGMALTVYLPKSRESLNAVDGQSVTSEFWESGAGGWAGLDSIVVKRRGASGVGPDHSVRSSLSHEYFHLVQTQLSSEYSLGGLFFVPAWLVEGTATWMQWRHGDVQGFDGLGTLDFAQRRRTVRSTRVSLESSAQPYSHGLVASDLLAQHAGEDALVEFWRLRSSWDGDSHVFWQDAFLEAFDMSAADFYSAFCRFRREETPPDYSNETLCLDDGVRIVSGALRDDDGTAISGAAIHVEPLDGTGSVGLSTRTDLRGRFTIRFADPGLGPVGLRVTINELCAGWYAAGGLVGGTAAIPLDDGIADIQITVTPETCRQIEGSVVGPNGMGRPDTEVVLSNLRGTRSDRNRTASDGSFAFEASPRGGYFLAVEFGDDCRVWFAGGDNVAAFRSDVSTLRPDDLNGIQVVVPENACRWSVRGRLLDSDGEGVADRRVSLQSERSWSGRSVRTGPDGSFGLVVPLPGEYRLSFYLPDCRRDLYYGSDGGVTFDRSGAALFQLGTQHVSGLVVEVLDGVCDGR